MYNDYYGFNESPFNITPDPRFLFFSERHREAFSHLLFGIQQRKGFIQITGEVGSGKTTLCRALLEKLGDNYKTSLILNPCLSLDQLLAAILKEFGIEIKKGQRDRVSMLETLNEFLLQQVIEGFEVVLIIDEAQDMSFELLEQVRLLSNLETDDRKLLQIVLIGQPELRDKINDKRLRQLRQRITVRYHLTPLSRREMDEYIRHRIHVCGGNGQPTFSSWATRKIYGYSKGIPRLVNAVCDKALLCGFVAGVERLNARHIRRAIAALEGDFA
ncbi:AAA family ATPase [Planctomycetales bacterium ZRK34]|nr:AAA family ATPase [Planctomycetales bacterium ZRK34]